MGNLNKCLLIILIIISFSCYDHKTDLSSNAQGRLFDTLSSEIAAGKFSTQSKNYLDSHQTGPFFKKYMEFHPYSKTISQFYRNRNWQMAWFDSKGRVEQVLILYNRIKAMEENGIPYEVHYYDEYSQMLEQTEKDSITWQELMFTSQYLHYAEKMTLGLTQKALLENDWHIPKKRLSFEILLKEMLAKENHKLDELFFYQYELLRQKLLVLQGLNKKGGWTIPDKTVKTYKKGDTGRIVLQIMKRLNEEDLLTVSNQVNEFDEKIESALKEFQRRNGLLPDGIAGRYTLAAMRITVRERIEQVMVNMERCRWLPATKKSTYIMVNVPDYRLNVIKNDTVLFTMPAIVGKETNKTAIFKGEINEIVFNPYWNIPKSIAEKEIIPLLRKYPAFLEQNNMEWYGGQLRQRPGADNALGKIKFLFPNPFNIYLHDTPGKYLFDRERRSFSHGCIRIGDPVKLASYLLSFEKNWNEERISVELSEKKEHSVHLTKPFPVYIVYLTAFVDAEGKLNFREDLYNRDSSLAEMLLKN